MIGTITLLTALSFAAVYPLCFWISARDPLKNNFHHFHIGLPCVIAGVILAFLPRLDFPPPVKIYIMVWAISLLVVSFFEYKKTFASAFILTAPCLVGIAAFLNLQEYLVGGGWQGMAAGLIGALVFSSALFAMNLGHWYLNVHGLPIGHLRKAAYAFGGFIVLRFIFDTFIILTTTILWDGVSMPLFNFMGTLDGFLLFVPLLFGVVFPLSGLYFVKGTLDLKNTQATTGILYVLLCAILLADIAFKYFLIKFSIPL